MTQARISFSPRGKINPVKRMAGLVKNDILGWVTVDEINQCVKNKIITFKEGVYCIPMELKLIIKDGDGKMVRNPSKEWVVSRKYIDYMIKNGRMKQDA